MGPSSRQGAGSLAERGEASAGLGPGRWPVIRTDPPALASCRAPPLRRTKVRPDGVVFLLVSLQFSSPRSFRRTLMQQRGRRPAMSPSPPPAAPVSPEARRTRLTAPRGLRGPLSPARRKDRVAASADFATVPGDRVGRRRTVISCCDLAARPVPRTTELGLSMRLFLNNDMERESQDLCPRGRVTESLRRSDENEHVSEGLGF